MGGSQDKERNVTAALLPKRAKVRSDRRRSEGRAESRAESKANGNGRAVHQPAPTGSTAIDPMRAAELDLAGDVLVEPMAPEVTKAPPASTQVTLTPKRLQFRLFVADTTAIFIGAAVAFGLWLALRPVRESTVLPHVLLFLAAYPIWAFTLVANKLYIARAVERSREEITRVWRACAVGTIEMVAIAFAFQFQALSRFWVLAVLIGSGLALTFERCLARQVFHKLRRSGRITRRVAIIGTDIHAIHLVHTLQSDPGLGYTPVGFIGDKSVGTRGDCSWLGDFDESEGILSEYQCGGAIISVASVPADDVNRLTRTLTDHGFHVALSSSLRDISIERIRPQSIDGRMMLYVEPTIRDGWRARAKRCFDMVVSVIALIITSPVILVAGLAIKLESGGPIFFRQVRVGIDGREFRIIKLRTMVVDAEQRRDELLSENEVDGPLFKITNDPRVTRVGRFLRKWSIDELPQFYNVLRGDMSVVGPRPALPGEVVEWEDEVRERLRVLPGITGLWQVTGRSNTTFDEYKRLDLYYVDNWSLLHDVRIVMMTFVAVAFRRGAK